MFKLLVRLAVLYFVVIGMKRTFAWSADAPPWTERTSYVRGDELYVVGVASGARSLELGRQAAFEHGVREIQNYMGDVQVPVSSIQTQVTYEERERAGTWKVFRMLRVPLIRLKNPAFVSYSIPDREPASTVAEPWESTGWSWGLGLARLSSPVASESGYALPLLGRLERRLGPLGLRFQGMVGSIGAGSRPDALTVISGSLGATLSLGPVVLGVAPGLARYSRVQGSWAETKGTFGASLGYEFFQGDDSRTGVSVETSFTRFGAGDAALGLSAALLFRF